jgi:hypothetical protein
MIQINLLPLDEQKGLQYRQRKLPIVPFLVGVFLFLIGFWVLTIVSLSYYKAIAHAKVARYKEIEPRKLEVDVLWDDLHNNLLVKKEHIDTILISSIEWAHVLNMISDYTSQGIWLTKVSLENKDDLWLLTLSGLAKPVTSRSMIKDIGNYVTNVKDSIEASIMQTIKSEKEIVDFIQETTTTKRKKASSIELTEFTTIFKIKG